MAQGLDALKQLLERALADDVRFQVNHAADMIVVVHRGMRLLGVPTAQRDAWLETVYRRLCEKFKKSAKGERVPGTAWHWFVDAQIRIAELFVEDGRTDRAKQVLVQAMDTPPEYDNVWHNPTQYLMGRR